MKPGLRSYGGRLAELAASRGLAGVVVGGCVRDAVELSRADVGILALASHPRKSSKSGAGERDVAVGISGVEITPGNYVYADADGVVLAGHALL